MDLTDEQWTLVQPLIPTPSQPPRGRPPIDERCVLDAILWKLRTRSPWYDLPPGYPSHQTVYRRYRQWLRQGVLSEVLIALFEDLKGRGGLDFEHFVNICTPSIDIRRLRWRLPPPPEIEQTWQLSTAQIFLWIVLKCAREMLLRDKDRIARLYPRRVSLPAGSKLWPPGESS